MIFRCLECLNVIEREDCVFCACPICLNEMVEVFEGYHNNVEVGE